MLLERFLPIFLLFCSNIFMTFAWYGHLKFKGSPLWIVVLVSWGIAFIEYWFAVPANRIGYGIYSGAELKGLQEIITLIVFSVFSIFYLGERLAWNHIVGFVFIVMAVIFIFRAWENVPFFKSL